MKTLKELLESKKTYPFKVGVAGEIPEGFNEKLKTALERFGLASISAGKKTPIQKRALDFPQLENTEVTYWDVVLNYPTTDNVLAEYLGNFCTVHRSCIIARNPNGPVDRQQDEAEKSDKDTVYDPLLGREEKPDTAVQNIAGESRIMELLKELEKDRKERGENGGFAIEAPKEESTNVKSVVGK
jgi:hypothetical protein